MVEWNLEELLAIRKPDELSNEPPFKAKILDVEASVREFDGREVPQVIFVLRRLATQTEDGEWRDTPSSKPFRLYFKVSKRKASKYGALLDALWKVAPDIMKNAKSLKDLKGAVFVWETKEQRFGNIIANVTLPTQFVGIEPITEEEKAMLENGNETDEIAKEFNKELDEVM